MLTEWIVMKWQQKISPEPWTDNTAERMREGVTTASKNKIPQTLTSKAVKTNYDNTKNDQLWQYKHIWK